MLHIFYAEFACRRFCSSDCRADGQLLEWTIALRTAVTSCLSCRNRCPDCHSCENQRHDPHSRAKEMEPHLTANVLFVRLLTRVDEFLALWPKAFLQRRLSREASGMVKLRGSNGAKHPHRPENAVALASFAERCAQSDGERWRLSREASGVIKLRGSNGAKHSHWPENAVALASFAEQCARNDGERWRLRL